jgi:hypothetical protein
VDEAHDTLSGPATQKLLQRTHHNFHDARYAQQAKDKLFAGFRGKKTA